MTVKLLVDWKDSRDGKQYFAGNLLTTDAGTETGLIAAKQADSNTAGGTAWVAPAQQAQSYDVQAVADPLTGGIKLSAGGQRLSLPQVISLSAVAASVTGTAAETTLATIEIPALGLNDAIRLTAYWTYTGSVNAKTMKAKLGGNVFGQMSEGGSASNVQSRQEIMLMNRNATNSQLGAPFGSGYSNATSGSPLNPGVETNAGSTLTLTGQLANTGETITLQGYMVELIRAPS